MSALFRARVPLAHVHIIESISTILCSGGNSIRSPSASEDVVSSHVGDSKHAKFSISDAGAASEHFSSANVTHDKQSLQEIPSQLPPPLERGNLLSEPEVGQGDGSEFWS
jgi:hypothetical protein